MVKSIDLAIFFCCRGCISCVAPVEGNESVLEVQAIDCTPALVTMEVEEKPADLKMIVILFFLLPKPSKLPE